MSKQKLDDIPESLDALIKFWSEEDIVEKSSHQAVRADILDYLEWVQLLKKEISRQREVLEFYADKDNWKLPSFGQGHSRVVADRGNRARQSLEKEQTL